MGSICVATSRVICSIYRPEARVCSWQKSGPFGNAANTATVPRREGGQTITVAGQRND
jgi:hypothetical protein